MDDHQQVVVALDDGLEFRVIPINDCEPHPDNANVEDLAVFNELVAGMKRDGVLEPILVVPHGDKWRIIAGEHRWKSAKLAGKTHVPAIVNTTWDETEGMVQLVRMNVVRGKLDPERFTSLYTKLKAALPEADIQRRMGLHARESELKRVLKGATKGLPKHIADDIEKRAAKVRRVEDLATVVQGIFAKYGGTIQHHFVAFSFGGMTHLMVQASKETFAPIQALADACQAAGLELDAVLAAKAACTCAECMQLTQPPALPAHTEET